MIITNEADRELADKISAVNMVLKHMEGAFPNCKLTFIARHKDSYEHSILATKDSPREIINAVRFLGKKMEIKDKA